MEPILMSAVVIGGISGLTIRLVRSIARLSSVTLFGLVVVLFLIATFGFQRYIWATTNPGDPAWEGPAWLLSWVYSLGASTLALICLVVTFALTGLVKKKTE